MMELAIGLSIVMFIVRIIVPLMLTIGLVKALRRLDARWAEGY